MQDAAQPTVQDPHAERCPRCLQAVPANVARCPDCRQPIHSLRLLPLAIGAAGLLALLFVMLVMYRMVRNEDVVRAPVPVDDRAHEQELFPAPPPAGSQPSEPAKPEKRPPLNEH